MAFVPYARRPVAFGYALFFDPQQQSTAQSNQQDLRGTRMVSLQPDVPVKTERFRLGRSRPRTVPPADMHHNEQSTLFAPPMTALPELPDRRGSGTEMGTHSASLTVGAASSFHAQDSSRSASTVATVESECSSMAPYWVPEEIKHYFRHRHSAAAEGEGTCGSQKTDSALRDIGRERELPAADSSIWSRWTEKWCHSPRRAVLMVMGVAVGALLVMLLITVAAGLHLIWPKSGLHTGGAPHGDDAAGADGGLGDFLMPAPKYDHKRDRAKRNEDYGSPEEITADSPNGIQREETGNGGGGALPKRDNSDLIGGLKANGAIVLRKATRHICEQPVFRFCSGGPPEFYYNRTSNACVLLSSDAPGVCNRGRNRFASMDSCQQQCVDIQTPAPDCYQKAVFAECQARDIIDTWWWYMDGKGCRRWRFPHGRCPSNGTDVFRTSLDCVRRCADPKTREPCRPPTAVPCDVKQLRFGFFTDADPRSPGARRCRDLSSVGGERSRHCLAGANRFPTMEDCRKACMQAVT